MHNRFATLVLPILASFSGILPAAASDAAAEMTRTPESSAAPSSAVPSSAVPSPAAARERAITLAEPFTLELHQTARLGDGLAIRFEAVDEDSRCPADVVCVWEGNAAASFSASTTAPQVAALRLDTNAGFTTAIRFADYTIRLLRLDPYPRTDIEIPEPYRATLMVIIPAVDQSPPPGT